MSLHCCLSINTQGQRGGGKGGEGAWFLLDKAGQRCTLSLKANAWSSPHTSGESVTPRGVHGFLAA